MSSQLRSQARGSCHYLTCSYCLVFDRLLFGVLLGLYLYLVTMKRAPSPMHNAFQSYVRFILGSNPAALSRHRRLCSSCLKAPRRTSKRAHVTAHTSRARPKHQLAPSVPSQPWQPRSRAFATVVDREEYGPMKEYNDRIHSRKLREDEHQRSQYLSLQALACADPNQLS